MPFSAFLKVRGIEGESTDAAHKGCMEILSYRWRVDREHIAHKVIGDSGQETVRHVAGRVEFGELIVKKVIDAASPALFLKCARFDRIGEVVLSVGEAGGQQAVDFLTITLANATISAVEHTAEFSESDQRPVEEVRFRYEEVDMEYTTMDHTGKRTTTRRQGWQVTTGRPR